MIYLNDIPYNKVFKRRVTLPITQGSMYKYNIVFMNNRDLDTNIKLMHTHPMIDDHSKYVQYYIDTIYKEKIGLKRSVINMRTTKKELYEKVSDEALVKPIVKTDLLMDKNTWVDLHVYNDIFFSLVPPSLNILKRATMYFDYIVPRITDSRFNSYKKRIVLIDVSAWMGTEGKKLTGDQNSLDNPVVYFFVILKKAFEKVKALRDIDLCFYTNEMVLRFDVKNVDEKSYRLFQTEINKMLKGISLDDVEVDNDTESAETVDKPVPTKNPDATSRINVDAIDYKSSDDIPEVDEEIPEEEIEEEEDTNDTTSTGDGDSNLDDSLFDRDDALADSEDDTDSSSVEKDSENQKATLLTDDISDTNLDDELLYAMQNIRTTRRQPRSEASLKRDKELQVLQKKLKVDGKTIPEWTEPKPEDYVIEETNVSSKVTTTNDNVKTIKYANFDKAYNEKMMKKDTMRVITSLNDKELPIYIRDIKVEDSSDELNYKETYTVSLEDGNRVRHTLKFDMPKFYDNQFMYLGGNKKIINSQFFLMPVLKTGPDEVQIVTNYNKIFLRRFGGKMSSKTERFKKFLSNPIDGVKVTFGNSTKINIPYKTTLEYDIISEKIVSVSSKDATYIFDQGIVHEKLKDRTVNMDKDFMCIGFTSNNDPIYLDLNREIVVGSELGLIDYIVESLGSKAQELYEGTPAGGKKFMYTRATIMAKDIPIVLLLGYCEGLSTVLKKGNVNHYFTDKRPRVDTNQGVVQFSDGYLVYDRFPYQNSLLMNALEGLPTKAYSYADMDSIDVYIDLFDTLFNSRNLASAFDTFYEFMIDPITKEILEDLKYPTDFVSLVLFANSLLADNSFDDELNMNNVRLRTNEILNAILYKNIADAYSRYRVTSANRNPVKMSIPKDAIIKSLLSQPTVEDYSTLNPIYESTKTRIASLKGLNGMNLDDSYSERKRAYDKTMVGTVGISTSPDKNVGVHRYLTMEPSVTGVRGYINANKDDLKDVNMLTPGELLTPGCVTRDDSLRVSMASKQSTHIVPVEKASPVLISNGTEQTIQYYLSSDFTIIADEDGEVVERDDNIGVVVVKYKSGKCRAIDLKPRTVKNASSGFYLANTMTCDLKVGQKVKANDIIAYDSKFFTNDGFNGNRFNIGSLQKVAIMSTYANFEDSSFVTKKISEDMASDIIMMKDVIIGADANVSNCVKIGDHVEVGDVLIAFEKSHDDDAVNKMLASVGEELQEDIKALGKQTAKSKYAGVIQDIKIYATVDLEEMSPSLRALVASYYSKINKKKNLISKYDKSSGVVRAGMLLNETSGKLTPGVDGTIKGRPVFDGVLIEFYIKYHDPITTGDKITYFSALKSTIGEVIDEGYEPYSEYRPDEEVSAFIAPLGILARQVPSTIIAVLGNKAIVELKRHLKEIYEE